MGLLKKAITLFTVSIVFLDKSTYLRMSKSIFFQEIVQSFSGLEVLIDITLHVAVRFTQPAAHHSN